MTRSIESLKKLGLPKTSGRLQVRGVDGPVTIIRDRWGAVHIQARTEHDAWFGQGFCHAQDRLWQMERSRRFARGALSEILGEALVPVDKYYRRLGIQRVAARDFPQLNAVAQAILVAFCEGVNAAVASMRKLPPEFAVLDLTPQPWTPADSIAVWKTVYLTQTADYTVKIFRAALIRQLGPDTAALLDPGYPEEAPVVFPPGSHAAGLGEDLAELLRKAVEFAPLSGPVGGSNNWVVDGSLSVSGKPLLAGDPHAVIQTAPVWHMTHLRTPEWEATGVNTPGVPGILLYGHNGSVGWTVTNAMADIADLFIEKFDAAYRNYLYRGRWLEAEVRREEIKVKGRMAPVVEDVPVTIHGPLVSGGPLGAGAPVSWQWTGHRVVSTFECIPGMLRAKNVYEFRESQRDWAGPPMNRVLADTAGNIAYQLLPEIPIRAHGGGNMVPAPGWTGENDWTGNIPFDELPWGVNPPGHRIVSANNRVTGRGYKYHVNALTIPYRAQRIRQMLGPERQYSIQDFKTMQGDRFSGTAAAMVSLVKKLAVAAGSTGPVNMLADWDAVIAPGSPAAALYEVFLQKLLGRVFDCTRDIPGAAIVMERWCLAYLSKLIRMIEDDNRALLEINPATRGKTWAGVLSESLDEAWSFLRERLGADPAGWAWAKLHRQTLVHNLGRAPEFAGLFNIPPVGLGGDGTTVFNSGGPYLTSLTPTVGVSFRMLLDFADLAHGWWVLPPGQSGHPGSAHYSDGVEPWRNVEYRPLLWKWDEIKTEQEGRLRLAPDKRPEVPAK